MRSLFILLLTTFCLVGQQNFVLVGPPGSGKGTFSAFMKATHGCVQICPGDILRAHIRNGTELGKEIKPIVERGDYIDDQIVFNIIGERISDCIEKKQPFIIDGFPRNNSSYNFLVHLFKKKQIESSILFVHFQISDQTCIDRINTRLFCFDCSSVFNTITRKSKYDMTCDECGNVLEIRLGDNSLNTIKRLAYFRTNIEPLIERAKEKYSVFSVDAEASLEDCLASYKKLLQ